MPKEKLVLGIPTFGLSFIMEDENKYQLGDSILAQGYPGRQTRTVGMLASYEVRIFLARMSIFILDCLDLRSNSLNGLWTSSEPSKRDHPRSPEGQSGTLRWYASHATEQSADHQWHSGTEGEFHSRHSSGRRAGAFNRFRRLHWPVLWSGPVSNHFCDLSYLFQTDKDRYVDRSDTDDDSDDEQHVDADFNKQTNWSVFECENYRSDSGWKRLSILLCLRIEQRRTGRTFTMSK